ncbi:restriction endonuclease [Nonomuraea wenchangensis]|uniref:restriction endonuclease n=1 Tax=Nonomuraea wenchangensis TaxID=568860 RepID=UPI0015A6F696|nr:restriction endonuclease [Nonomuraea wenchangensis]
MAVGVDKTRTTKERGQALEDLFCYLLAGVQGLKVRRNILNPYRSEEVDVAVANDRVNNGLACFPYLFLVECKNWSDPVDAKAISAFINKLENRSIELGILVAASGVTGDPSELTSAYQTASMAQARGRRLLLLSLKDLTALTTSDDLTDLLVQRLLGVVACGTFELPA